MIILLLLIVAGVFVWKRYSPSKEQADLNKYYGKMCIRDRFVGPSGCGKSTTLRMIAGLEKISDGTLVMDGKTMNDVQSCDRDIAMVFQNYALYPHMTVAENMAYSLRLKHVPKKERRQKVEEVAKILGLEQVLDLSLIHIWNCVAVCPARPDPADRILDLPDTPVCVYQFYRLGLHVTNIQFCIS